MSSEITAAADKEDIVAPRNAKHLAFADEFLKHGNATKAAIAAGYSAHSAGNQGAQILRKPPVAAYIAAVRAKQTEKAVMSAGRWTDELSRVAFSNIQDFTRLDDDGNLLPDFSNATREQLAAVSAVKFKTSTRYGPRGEVIGTDTEQEFKLWDKLKAAELLGKHAGLLKESEQRVVVDVADRLLGARARLLRARDCAPSDAVIEGGEG